MLCIMAYIIQNCVYKMINAVKGQQTQKHRMIQKRTNKEIEKRFRVKKEKK